MQITDELVAYVAELSRIRLNSDEISEMRTQMNEIVNYMDVLNQLDTEDIEPLSHVFNVTNVLREDTVQPSLPREDILKGAPQHTDEAFIVPKTVE